MKGIGLMSGSSLDGVDLAFVSFNDGASDWNLLETCETSIPDNIKNSLKGITLARADEMAITESQYTSYLAKIVNEFIADNNLKPDFLAVHGHTVLHYPENEVSWQMVNGGMLNAKTGLTVITDFRNQDMSFGGQGTPMAVLVDRDLFPGYDMYVNLGGIANVSLYNDGWHAYDICPCNQVLNYFALSKKRPFDKDGMLAQSGHINHDLLNVLKHDDFILKKGPKSIDNQSIIDHWIPLIKSVKDTEENYLRTYVEFIADCILDAAPLAAAKIMLSGGGANNLFMIDVLKEKLSSKKIEFSMPSQEIINFKEAILMAYAGYLRLLEKPNFVSEATGASLDTIGGAVYISSQKNIHS